MPQRIPALAQSRAKTSPAIDSVACVPRRDGSATRRLRGDPSRIESALDPTTFCRIHRSTIVNIDRIQAVESLFRGEYLVVLHDGTKLTSGRSYRHLHALMGEER